MQKLFYLLFDDAAEAVKGFFRRLLGGGRSAESAVTP